MGFFSCFRGKWGNRSSRGKGPAPVLPNLYVSNELPHVPTLLTDHETMKRATTSAKELQATSSAKELQANSLSPSLHREKKLQTASSAKELLSEPSRNEDYITHTTCQNSRSPEPDYYPRFVDSAIGTPESKRSTPGASRSTSSNLSVPTECDSPSTPTPARRYISRGTNPSPPPITPFVLKASQMHSAFEEYPAESSIPKVPQTHSAPEKCPPTSSFSPVPPKPEPKVLNPQAFSSPSPEPVARRASSVTPKPEPEPEVTNTQIHSSPLSSSSSPRLYTAPHTPEPQLYHFGAEKPWQFTHQVPTTQRFTSGPQPTQCTQSSQSSNIATPSTQGIRAPQSFNSSPQSSQSSTPGIQPPQGTQQTKFFSSSALPSQNSQSPQPLNFNTPLQQRAQASQPLNFSAPPPQSARQSPYFVSSTQQAPRPSPTNAVIPGYNSGTHRGTCTGCGTPNRLFTTRTHDNYNYGREFRKCPKCQKWNGFTDKRGLSQTNYKECLCRAPMRLSLNRDVDEMGMKTAFYSCQYMRCNETETFTDEYGDVKLFDQYEIEQWVAQGHL